MLHGRMLRYLDEVARSGSIRRAATKLNVASTAINRQILALEEELGEPIFERLPRRLRLTATGEVLIEHVRETLKNYGNVTRRLEALKGVRQGQITIATTFGLAAGPVARIVDDFLAQHPRVQVRIRSLTSEAIANAVLAGEVAIGLGFNLPANPGLRTVILTDVPFGAVVRPGHPLAAQGGTRLVDVAQFPLVLAEPAMTLRMIVDQALARLPGGTAPRIETNSIELMKQYVRRGEAVAFLNPIDVSEDVAAGTLVYLPLQDRNLQPQPLRLVARQRGFVDPLTSLFVEHLRVALAAIPIAGGTGEAIVPGRGPKA